MKYRSIGEICTKITDYVANGSFKSLKENVIYTDESQGYAVLIRLTDYRNNFKGPFQYINKAGYQFLKKTKLYGGEIIISNVGTHLGTTFKAPQLDKPMSLGPNAIVIDTKYNNDYYYYFLSSPSGQELMKTIVSGSAQPKFNKTAFKRLLVPVPPLEEQERIANIFLQIDKKIALNVQINENLLALAETIFKKYFPNVNSGKEKIGSYIANFDKFRRPIANRKRLAIQGKYRYIGAAAVNDYIDKYNFDGIYLLLGEDGSVEDKDGYPVLQYVFGKFWPNNHVHVLQGKHVSTEWLYLFFRQKKVSTIITGAVQQKISQKNLKSLTVKIPAKDELVKFDQIIQPLFTKIRANETENMELAEIKQVLFSQFFDNHREVR